jgi:hypothetical protein
MATRKLFELLDCPKLAYPNLTEMDVPLTAANIADRLGSKSFLNYAQIWPLMEDVTAGRIDDAYLKRVFSSYPDEWKNENLQDVMRLLRSHFGGRGRWYNIPHKPVQVLPGAYFKPSIKGIWFFGDRAYSVLINARKGQRIWESHARFLGRGVYEFHAIDDPNNPTPLLVDLSAPLSDRPRQIRVFDFRDYEMMGLVEFEIILRKFFEALALAGVTTIPDKIDRIGDLFRKRHS